MTKDEFALFQAKMKIVALETLLGWTADILKITYHFSPVHERAATYAAFRKKLADVRADYSDIAFPELTPEMSDLQASEFQEIFDRLSKDLEAKVCGSNGT